MRCVRLVRPITPRTAVLPYNTGAPYKGDSRAGLGYKRRPSEPDGPNPMDEICPLVGAKLTLHLRLRTLAGRTGFQPHGQEDGRNSTRIRLFFAYTDSMAFGMQDHKLFVVQCKRCRRDVPAGVPEFPFQSIVVACPLCGEQRRYLPSEVFLGWPNHLVAMQVHSEPR